MKVHVRGIGDLEVKVIRMDDKAVDDWRDYELYHEGHFVGRVTTAYFRHGGKSWTPGPGTTGMTIGYPTRKEAVTAAMFIHYGLRT